MEGHESVMTKLNNCAIKLQEWGKRKTHHFKRQINGIRGKIVALLASGCS